MPLKTSRHAWTRLNSLQSGTQETAWISENRELSQKDKSHSETYSNKQNGHYTEQGTRRWQAPLYAQGGWASAIGTRYGAQPGVLWCRVTQPPTLWAGICRAMSALCNCGAGQHLEGKPRLMSRSRSVICAAGGCTDRVYVTGERVAVCTSECVWSAGQWCCGFKTKYETAPQFGPNLWWTERKGCNGKWRRELTEIQISCNTQTDGEHCRWHLTWGWGVGYIYIYLHKYQYIYLCKTDGLMVTDSPQACSCVCQVPGGSVACVCDRGGDWCNMREQVTILHSHMQKEVRAQSRKGSVTCVRSRRWHYSVQLCLWCMCAGKPDS